MNRLAMGKATVAASAPAKSAPAATADSDWETF
jgi:hypothetical protein